MRRDAISWTMVLVGFAASACGDDTHKKPTPDAFQFQDAPPDSSMPPACDYTEAHDTTNDYNLMTGFTPEETAIAFNGTTKTICGTINNGHFSSTYGSIDIDDYKFSVTADTDVIVTLTGSGLQNISSVGIFSVDSTQARVGGGYFFSDHAVFSAHLAAGSYEISAEAYGNADIATAIPYKLKIAKDMPLTRCPHVTGTPSFVEANDGALSTANDTVSVNYANSPSYATTTPGTTPEPTNLTLAAGTSYLVTGNSAMRVATDSYLDKDTFQVTTGATTNQLSVRLNWASTTTDFDLLVFTQGTYNPPIAISAKMMLGEDEFLTTAVAPNTTYWIWVGAYMSSTIGASGSPYDLSLCAENFTP